MYDGAMEIFILQWKLQVVPLDLRDRSTWIKAITATPDFKDITYVIVIDDVDVPNELAETDNNAEVKEEHVTIAVPNQHDVVDDEVLLTPIKRSKKNHIKISARNRLYRVFDEEEDEDEAENKNPWEVDDGVGDEDEVDDENEVDDEDDWN
ncbi:hypothetical protein Tco_0675815 [Tanacetum coccineum]